MIYWHNEKCSMDISVIVTKEYPKEPAEVWRCTAKGGFFFSLKVREPIT